MEIDEETTNMAYFCQSDDEDETDRISDMPDDVLCRILSFMPTKNAMAAKILSTRWGRLFPFFWIPPIVIDLDDTSFLSYEHGSRFDAVNFKVFADRLLHETLINVPCLDVLNFKCRRHTDEEKLSWIRAALRLNVRELSLYLHWYILEPEELFHMLNGYKGLSRLELLEESHLELPDGFTLPDLRTLLLSDLTFYRAYGCSLPNLRTLNLTDVQIYSDENNSLHELINRCFVLEVLSFKRCGLIYYGDSSTFRFSIKCPLLKNLTIEDRNHIWECSLSIDAPNLQVLVFKGFAAKSYTVHNPFNSLVSAHIDVELSYPANGVEGLVAACSSAVDLYLCAFLMDVPHFTRVQLPMFKNLNQLALGYIQRSGWAILARLLLNSPNLENLTFKEGFYLHDGGYLSFESLMTSNPQCLELHLKEIEFVVFNEKEDEIKLVEYFMNNGKVIEKVKLHCLPFKHKSTRERLAMLPRQSKLVFKPRHGVVAENDLDTSEDDLDIFGL